MSARIIIGLALGCLVAATPSWAAPNNSRRGGGKTLVKGASRRAKPAAPKPAPRFPLNALPPLQQAVEQLAADQSPGLKAMPFSMKHTVAKDVIYNYNFLSIDGEKAHLIYEDDNLLITYEPVSGNHAKQSSAVHLWSSWDYSYIGSVLICSTYIDTAPGIHVEPQTGAFALELPPSKINKVGGWVAYAPGSGDFEIRNFSGSIHEWALSMSGNFGLKLPCFAGFSGCNGIKIPLNKLVELQQIPQFHGLVHHFVSGGEETIRRIDFNSLRLKPSVRVPCASEIQISDIEGLPEPPAGEEFAGAVLEDGNSGYLLISLKRCLESCWWGPFLARDGGEEVPILIYDSRSKSLLQQPGEVFEMNGGYAYEPYYRRTDIGHWVHNAFISTRLSSGDWEGPMLQNPETGKNSVITFGGEYAPGATYSDDIKDIAYKVGDKLPGWESLGVSLCVWAPLPGDDTKSYWLAGGEGICALILMDETTKSGRVVQSWRGTWGRTRQARNVPDPVWLPDKQWLCLPSQTNCWDVYEITDFSQPAEKLATICTGADDAWALVLPDGRYAGSPGCEKLLYKQTPEGRMAMDILAPWYNRPAEVLEAIGGNSEDVVALRQTTERWLAKLNMHPDEMPPIPSIAQLPECSCIVPSPMCDEPGVAWDINVKARSDKAVTGLEVRVNGALVPQKWSDTLVLPADRKTELEVQLPLNHGQNNITLTAINSTGSKGREVFFRLVRPGTSNSRLFVVTLGVSDYDDDSLDLQFAAKDARDIAASFREHGSGEVKTLTLTDKEVADKGVLDKVSEFLAETTEDDRVVVYLAGHGMLDEKLEYHYAPAGFDTGNVRTTGVSISALARCLQEVTARERLLLLDTCHSGQLGEAGEDKLAAAGVQLPHGVRAIQNRGMKVKKATGALTSARQQKRYIEDMFSLGQQYRGVNIVAGAAGAEFALESGEWNNGVFTASVMQTLADFTLADTNGDGVLSVSEMLPAIQARVQQLTGGAQMPNIVAAESSHMVIATDLRSEILSANWGAVAGRIHKAANSEDALFIFDRVVAYLSGAYERGNEWEYMAKSLADAGRIYDEEKQKVLEADFRLMYDRYTDKRRAVIPDMVWQAVLEKGVQADALYPWLGFAADQVTTMELLTKAGLTTCPIGKNPLIFEYSYSPAIIRTLLASGVSPDARNQDGKTLLQYLVECDIELSGERLETMLLLLQNGASTVGIGERSKRYSDFCDVLKLHQALSAAAPAPELPEGKAPATLGDSVLLLTYEGAESSIRSHEVEDAEPTPFQPYAYSFPQTIYANPGHEQGVVRHYRRTGADTAEIKVIYTAPNCQFAKLVAHYADRLTADQVYECLSSYMGDVAHELQLTFDSPTLATAQELRGDCYEEIIIRNVKVTLQSADFRLPESN